MKFMMGILLMTSAILPQWVLAADSSDESAEFLMGTLSATVGENKVVSKETSDLATTLVIKNTGTTDLELSRIKVVADARVIDVTSGDMGVFVKAGRELYLVFSNFNPVHVETVELTSDQSAGTLEIYGVNHSAPSPGGFSAGN